MALCDQNNKQLSPCIISKAKYALDIKKTISCNDKKCSLEYWKKVIDVLIKHYPKQANKREQAINKFKSLV